MSGKGSFPSKQSSGTRRNINGNTSNISHECAYLTLAYSCDALLRRIFSTEPISRPPDPGKGPAQLIAHLMVSGLLFRSQSGILVSLPTCEVNSVVTSTFLPSRLSDRISTAR